jgi:hypothetical protein
LNKGKTTVTLNIWQANDTIKILENDKQIAVINKNELLFLVGKDKDFYIFKTEGGIKIKLHINIEKNKRITKVF